MSITAAPVNSPGVYHAWFSCEVARTAGGAARDIEVELAQNGTGVVVTSRAQEVPSTGTLYSVSTSHRFSSVATSDTISVLWRSITGGGLEVTNRELHVIQVA
jgi:hypothetical protein